MDDADPRSSHKQREVFQALLATSHSSILQYILCLVPHWANAEDILQETELRLWEQFDRYQQGTNFQAWAISIAHYQVLTFRKKTKRSRVLFSQEVFDSLADRLKVIANRDEDSLSDALRNCMKKLPPESTELLRRCYGERESMKDIAANSSRSPAAVYKAVSRIRQRLRKCIQESLRE